jgi:hypothetical protein
VAAFVSSSALKASDDSASLLWHQGALSKPPSHCRWQQAQSTARDSAQSGGVTQNKISAGVNHGKLKSFQPSNCFCRN